jgi:hypothetical protein
MPHSDVIVRHARTLRQKYAAGEILLENYEQEESLEKNRISNISTVSNIAFCCIVDFDFFFRQVHSNIGFVVTLCLNLSLLIPLANNPKVTFYLDLPLLSWLTVH